MSRHPTLIKVRAAEGTGVKAFVCVCVCDWTTNDIELGAIPSTCKHFRLVVAPVNSNMLSVNVVMLSSPGAVALSLPRCPRYVVRRDWIDCLSVVRG